MENGCPVENMAEVQISLQMEIFTMENTKMDAQTDKEFINGPMEVVTKEDSWTA